MPRHWHRFSLCQMLTLVAIVGLDFAIVPTPISWMPASLTLITALLASLFGPPSKLEWAAVLLIHAILILLLAGAQSSHCRGV